MTDTELNYASAKFLVLVRDGDGWYVNQDRSMRFAPADWSPATKIEHAWLVQAAACELNSVRFKEELEKQNPARDPSKWAIGFWLATAPPRARVEAALAAGKGE